MTLGPRSLERPADAGHTLVSGLEGIAAAKVDGGGCVTPSEANYSIDWWVGADDRWHLPAKEPAVRQRRVGHGPVIETSLRVPSGDVIHTVYPAVVPGGMATVIEVKNDSPVPVALAMALRPFTVDGPVGDGAERRFEFVGDELVHANGHPALQLPRRPNELGGSTEVDLLNTVNDGQTLAWQEPVAGPSANVVCLYPLPHGTSLRFAIPGPGITDLALDGLPDAASAARGWTVVVDRASSYQFPDSGLTDLSAAARARLLLASPTLIDAAVDGAPGAGLVLLGLARGGHRLECRRVVDAVTRSFPSAIGSPREGAELVAGLSAAAELLGDSEVTDWLLDPVSQLTHLVEKAAKKRRREPASAEAINLAKRGLATLADLSGQADAAADLRKGTDTPADMDLEGVTRFAAMAAPARRWATTINPSTDAETDNTADHAADSTADNTADETESGELIVGPDSASAAASFWLAARALLIRPAVSQTGDRPVVELLPEFPTAWRGGTVEVHRAPVAGALVSFAIRWHGFRPALLWDVEGDVAVELRCPGLDPDWRTTEAKGEALLAGAAEELPEAPSPGDSFT